jgi:spore coat protein U-like protein
MSTVCARFVAAVLIALAAGSAVAATSTTTFQVTATVLSSCNVSAADLAFGTYDPLAASPTDGTSTVTVQCTLLAPFNIGLNAGVGAGATVATRIMTSGGNTLAYSLYQDAARTTVWGNTPATDTVSGTGTGVAVPFTVYGRIPNGQNAAPGSYADTITVTVNF